jgi:general secretion pathway protein D
MILKNLCARRLACALLAVLLVACAASPDASKYQGRFESKAVTEGNSGSNNDDDAEIGKNAGAQEQSSKFLSEGTGEFLQQQQTGSVARRPQVEGEASFNFEAAGIPEVVKAILGEFLQENYVIAPGVGGQVTFSTTQPVKAEQAMGILEMLLALNNTAIVWRDGKYLVTPVTDAVRANAVPLINAPEQRPGFQVRAVPLNYISATEVEKLMQTFGRAGAVLRVDVARSLIVLGGTPQDLANYVATIRTFDVDWMAGMSFGLLPLERVEVKDVMPELEAIFSDQASPLAGVVKLLPVERLNAVMVITSQKRYLREVEKWMQKLDRGGSESGVRLYVYDVKNVKAVDLADRLNEIFTGQQSQRSSSSASGRVAPGLNSGEISSSGGRSVAARNQPVPPVPTTPVNNSAGATGTPGSSLIEGAEDVRITAVEENNSLLIRATPTQYEVIKSAMRRLDIEPLQVHIEARILEVSLTKNLNMGVQWYLENFVNTFQLPGTTTTTAATTTTGTTSSGISPGGGTGTTTLPTSNPLAGRDFIGSLGGTLGGGGLTYVFDGRSTRALITALQSEGDVNVLSAPSVVVLNNKEAAINVGQQIPVVSSFFNQNSGLGTGGINGSQGFVQFRDTGISLSVTPRVNPGGMVYMEISQEQSTPGATADATGNVPVNQKTIQTEIAVQSGMTVLLGGLIQQTENNSRAGLPGLNKIPVLGRLFGTTRKDSTRSELLVLITPTVIRGGAGEMQALTEEYKSRFEGLDALIREENRRRPAMPQSAEQDIETREAP